MLLQDATPFFAVFVSPFCVSIFLSFHFDMPEAYLVPSQLFKIEPFSKIVKDFQAITYLQKTPSYMIDCLINAPLCSEHINNHFH